MRARRLRLVAADALVAAVGEHAQQLGLQRRVDVADLVEEERARAGGLDAAGAPPGGAGEGAALVAEQLGLDQRRRQRGEVDRDERRRRARRVVVDRARHQLLAGAGLAGDEHRRVRSRGAADQLPDRQHRRRRADQARARRRRRRGGRRLRQPALRDRALDGGEQRREVERLGQIVEGAVAHGADGALRVAVRGRDDHRHVLLLPGADLAQELEPVAVAQADVEQDAVGRARGQLAARLGEAGRRRRGEAEPLDRADEPFTHAGLVLDDEHQRAHAAT
jgi:hypothetical protein